MEEITWRSPKEFNLIPPQVLRREERKRIGVSIIVTLALILVMSVAVQSLFPSASQREKEAPVFPTLALSESQLDLMQKRLFFSKLLDELATTAQGKVWFSALQFEGQAKTITLFGQGYSADHITEFVNQFQETAKLKRGKILSLSQDEDLIRVKWEGQL